MHIAFEGWNSDCCDLQYLQPIAETLLVIFELDVLVYIHLDVLKNAFLNVVFPLPGQEGGKKTLKTGRPRAVESLGGGIVEESRYS